MSGLAAFVLGATGETGKELINILATSKAFYRVTVIGRRKIQFDDEKFNLEQIIVNFDNLNEHAKAFKGFDVGFCCLGTTKGKSGADGFVRVDRDYVVQAAQLAKQEGCKQFHLLTAQGSNKNSWFLYPRTKGEAEESVMNLEFERLFIYRPGILLCDREVYSCFILQQHRLDYKKTLFERKIRLKLHVFTIYLTSFSFYMNFTLSSKLCFGLVIMRKGGLINEDSPS